MEFSNLFQISNFLLLIYFIFKLFSFLSSFYPQPPGFEAYEIADSDRLSALSDSLILEIFSFLPMRDVVGTTILSKRWKNLWTTIPCLHFEHPPDYHGFRKFRTFVNGALAAWKGPRLVKFSLRCTLRCMLDSWLAFAVEKQVEEVEISLMVSEDGSPAPAWIEYRIPSCLCSSSSIKKLSLWGCILRDDERVQWDQLVSLYVDSLDAFLGNVCNRILAGAPRLEILDLRVLGAKKELVIKSERLKVLNIHMFPDTVTPMLSVWAPNLETLRVSGNVYARCLLKVPCLRDAVVGFDGQACVVGEEFLRQVLLSIRHVEKLALSDLCIQALAEMKRNMFVPSSNAKFVKLFPTLADKILDVLDVFPQLRTLIIVREHMFDESRACNMIDPKTELPSSSLMHLRTVEVAWLVRDTSIYPVIEMLLKNAHALEKMVFRPIWFDEEEKMRSSEALDEAEETVLSMPRSTPTVEVIVSPSRYNWAWYDH